MPATRESNTSAPVAAPPPFARTALKAAWLSIGVGLAIEIALVIAGILVGTSPVLKNIISDGLGKVSWSIIVCTGLAIGTAASKQKAQLMGVCGLLAAPVGFTVARAIQKAVAQVLAAADPAAALPSIVAVSAVKGLEYALLGFLVGRLSKKTGIGIAAYAGTGTAIGAVFANIFIALAIAFGHPVPPPAKLTLLGVNEFLFPIGCSLVLYSAAAIGARLAKA